MAKKPKDILMWNTVSDILLANHENSQLHTIMDMIKKDLVYDDTGFFPGTLFVSDEKYRYTKTCTSWLLHQLNFLLTQEKYNDSMNKNLELQSEILSACLVKQSMLFPIFLRYYMEMLMAILQKPVPIIEIKTFHCQDFDLLLLHPQCEFKPIRTSNQNIERQLLASCLNIITHCVELVLNDNEDLVIECTELVLEALMVTDVKTKVSCVLYFGSVITNLSEYTVRMKQKIVSFLRHIQVMLEKQNVWATKLKIGRVVLETFNKTVVLIFNNLSMKNLMATEIDVHDVFSICVSSLQVCCTDTQRFADCLEAIAQFLYSYLEKMADDKIRQPLNQIEELLTLAEQYPSLLELIKQPMLHQLLGWGSQQSYLLWNRLVALIDKHMLTMKEPLSRAVLLESFVLVHIINHELNIRQYNNINPSEHLINPKLNILIDSKYQKSTIEAFLQFVHSLTLKNTTLEVCKFVIRMTYNYLVLFTDRPPEQLCVLLVSPFINKMQGHPMFNQVPKSFREAFLSIKELNKIIELSCQLVLKSPLQHRSDIINYLVTKSQDEQLLQIFINLHYVTDRCVDWIQLAKHHQNLSLALTVNLKEMLCISSPKALVLRMADQTCIIKCPECDNEFFEKSTCVCPNSSYSESSGKLIKSILNSEPQYPGALVIQNCHLFNNFDWNSIGKTLFQLFRHPIKVVRLNMILSLPAILTHTDCGLSDADQLSCWTEQFAENDVTAINALTKMMTKIMAAIQNKIVDQGKKDRIISSILDNVLIGVQKSIKSSDYTAQSAITQMVNQLACCDNVVSVEYLAKCVNCQIHFLTCANSKVSREASMWTINMCRHRDISPGNVFNWHRQHFLKLIVHLAVFNYLTKRVTLPKTVYMIAKTFGCCGSSRFIVEKVELLLALLLPWCIRFNTAIGLLNQISDVLQKKLATLLSASFLTIYAYLSLNEPDDVTEKCIDIVIENTGTDLYELLQSDLKRTVAELLIYYHKNPEWVLHAFSTLLSDNRSSTKMSLSAFADYICERFLGVITHFEMLLNSFESEKWMKEEMLLSLGEIIRALGTTRINQFRFKILAMLKTATSMESESDGLKDACIQIWTIFIHTIDIRSLGSLLPTIFLTLETMQATHPNEVTAIHKYLVIDNSTLLSDTITDLFFLDDMSYPIDEAVKAKVACARHPKRRFVDKVSELLKHVNHEDVAVRIHAIRHLTNMFQVSRKEITHLIFGQNSIDPIVNSIMEVLMKNCKHSDETLKLAAAKCIGELGAIEPTLFPANYVTQNNFALSVHTDLFAQIALTQLCRAYQCQQDKKYVDSFSYAIQEILAKRQVDPKSNKKMEIWEGIPPHLRPLMEPLVKSRYALMTKIAPVTIHPVFGSSKVQTVLDWALMWSAKLIEKVKNTNTIQMLNSLKPSMRRDMNLLSLFLPYIVLHSLQDSDPTNPRCNEETYEELQTIFTETATKLDKANTIKQREGDGFWQNETMRAIKLANFEKSDEFLAQSKTPYNLNEQKIKCAKLAFCQLDFLERWVRQWRRAYPETKQANDRTWVVVFEFLRKFDKKLVAQANFACAEYARALVYLEDYIMAAPNDRLQAELPLLEKIYAKLYDPDSLEGVMSVKIAESTLTEQITLHNLMGRLHESAACYERLLQTQQLTPKQRKELIKCYLGLDQPETALLVAETMIEQMYEDCLDPQLHELKAEPLWRLGRFEELDELYENLNIKESVNWGVQCGKLLLDFRNKNSVQFTDQLNTTRLKVLKHFRNLDILDESAYQVDYPNVLKLHLISEFENAYHLVLAVRKTNRHSQDKSSEELVKNYINDWETRLEFIQPTAYIMEPIISLRRLILGETKKIILDHFPYPQRNGQKIASLIDGEICKLWMRSTEYASNADMYHQANQYILNAEHYKPEELFLEKAKLLWKKGDQSNAFKTLEKGMAPIQAMAHNSNLTKLPKSSRKLYAEAKLLIAMYNAEKVNIGTELNLQYFKESVAVYSESEKSYVQLAAYLDVVYASLPEHDVQEHGGAMLFDIMTYYAKSMEYGCNFVHQSMPRLLTVWLDYTSIPLAKRKDEKHSAMCGKMNKFMERCATTLPTFLFYTTFSQLVSRICHFSAEVYNVLKTILVELILSFPQQCLWLIMSAYKSDYNIRKRRCLDVFRDKRLSNPSIQKTIKDFDDLGRSFVELTNKEIPLHVSAPTVSQLSYNLPKLLQDKKLSKIIVPIESQMHLVLPPIGDRDKPVKDFAAFSNHEVHIVGVREEIVVMQSLQKPRRIVLLGSNGQEYKILCKPKDDLRKDYRLMEFNSVVKQYLYLDPEARHRRLNIRTYQVLPLNEECGILEWVDNLSTFRSIVNYYYKLSTGVMPRNELAAAACKPHHPIERKREVFKSLVKRHPSVFSQWFREYFTNPHDWFQARSSYIRTTAVMSMVGHILGLGDRHGENILFDNTTGDTVHVDFNCLFNRGESFEYPEVVPFRLTHNMVSAMGPLGIEGPYRKCCEITLRVLRSQISTLMSVLRPFVYDPMVSWNKQSLKNDNINERTDAHAVENILRIKQRLNGFVKINGKLSSLPLSVKGQVNHLISEATSTDNLALMYIGWGGFM